MPKPDPVKRCSKCGLTKPWSAFTLRGKDPANRRPMPACKTCRNAAAKTKALANDPEPS